MGEFSAQNLKVSGGVIGALVAACALIVVPFGLYSAIRSMYSGSLTTHDVRALSFFLLSAVTLGVAITVTMYFHGSYPRGSKSRLFFGMTSGTLVVVYSIVVLVLSGLTSVLEDIGLRLDTKYVALMIAYASVPLMISAGGVYISWRKKWQESVRAAKKGSVSAR